MNKPSALSFLAIFLVLWPFGYIIHVQAAPIEFGVTDNRVKDPHYEENLNRIDEAAASAQWQIENVLHFLDPANRHLYNDYDKHIRNAYGDPTKVNVEAIRKTFEGLRDQKLHIGNMHAHKSTMDHQKAMAQINLEEKTVRLHHDFHDPNNTPELLPGILIHEASHTVGSFDWFNKKNAEIKGHHEQKSETEDLNPYLSNPKDFEEAKRLIPHKMHLNADSHRLLAHTVSFGWNVPVQPDPKSARKWNKTQDTCTHCRQDRAPTRNPDAPKTYHDHTDNEQVVIDAAGKMHHLKGLTVEMRGKTTSQLKKELECHNREVPEGNVAALCKIRKTVPTFRYRHKKLPRL
ncbi:hypothetical protein NLJ89_g2047 [Agrocybe chaxingu]|uniref:Uncharacterized protein n=1 Tax=Agrocybe chaxingu TaxID=84603 RepID=A0A9W8K7L1_9AGAR|nr:hypothetical protein NLJ89_g2047 [Agrocybe chaxingu]